MELNLLQTLSGLGLNLSKPRIAFDKLRQRFSSYIG